MPEAGSLFEFDRRDEALSWFPIDDIVMGGVSRSSFGQDSASIAVFAGVVSAENNGGFASVRSASSDYDLTGCLGIELRVRGDGKRYKVNLRCSRQFDGLQYQVSFETKHGEWETHRFAFSDFVPTFRGVSLQNQPPLDRGALVSFGLMISDKQIGPFRLEIDWIRAY